MQNRGLKKTLYKGTGKGMSEIVGWLLAIIIGNYPLIVGNRRLCG